MSPRARLAISVMGMVMGMVTGCAGTAPQVGGQDLAAGSGDLATCTGPSCFGLCNVDGDCKKGRCDVDRHTCVDCLKDLDCPRGESCSPSHSCVSPCTPMLGCGDAGTCEVDSGTCVECTSDTSCHDPARPRCDGARDRCVACLPANDNCPHGSYCVLKGNDFACVEGCRNDGDCANPSDGGMIDGGGADGGQPMTSGRCDTLAHQCVACLADDDCPANEICRANQCVIGCSAKKGCANALACCGGACSDPQSDVANCGGCGAACPGGWNCCTAKCANPASDLMNCGACGLTCAVAHGQPACLARSCAVASCDAGWSDCDGSYKDGCEAHTDTSPLNCGACGNVCAFAHAQAACTQGKCVIDTCLYPYQDCNGDPRDGCEINTGNDAMNCGVCKRACVLPHAIASCQVGACAIGSCQMGFGDCDQVAVNGCETNLSSNVNNCGGCGVVCAGINGAASCQGGVCGVKCNAGFADCDKLAANGCEVDLRSDAGNCGACGMVCGGAHVTKSSCNQSVCRVDGCDPGFADCNGVAGDGCEVNVLADAGNCGACKQACSANHIATPTCGAGVCNGTCDVGFGDCNSNKLADGCEKPVANDVSNCGACGNVCPAAPANATATCGAGTCSFACKTGFGDCDLVPANGCETSLLSDVKNCGACGKVCPNANTCANGVCAPPSSCQNGSTQIAISPNQDMIICHDLTNTVCEQDFATECPIGWRLCTPRQHANRAAGWNYTAPTNVLGEIFCRGGGGAGHWTINGGANLGQLQPFNCTDGSSRAACPTSYGCNETQYYSLCCKPTPTCGNGVVDSAEEECDDANTSELDGCLNDCAVRTPGNGC